MTVHEVTPAIDLNTLLAGAQFVDAFRIEIDDRALDARHAAERMMARQPRWAEALLTLRNILVTPFGLKTSGASRTASGWYLNRSIPSTGAMLGFLGVYLC